MADYSSPQHIIAIGASAGGIEAIYTFFDHTPLDHASYIIIQHLSPDHQSRLAQLLQKHAKLDIVLAEDGMVVEPNKIYVIPNKQFMTLKKGSLYLTNKAGRKGPHQTINTFFHSLAKDQGTKAIAVILSGMGSDGSDGIKAIKKGGGLVIVQDPDTATYDSMPVEALATGMADWVLSPEEMPMRIHSYVHQVHGHTPAHIISSDAGLSDKEENTLVAILNLLKSKLPLDFTEYKRTTIYRRIRKRMAHHQVSDSKAYLDLLTTDALEIEALAQDFLISVTSFFRDREAFEIIERDIIPHIMQQTAGGEVKIWVAGCATGEEAYSLAILVQEYLDKAKVKKVVKIFATDLDKAALTKASKGIYPESIASTVLKPRLERFFVYEKQTYRIKPELRKMLIFAPHNLGKNPPYAHMDLISCRNLLIYMNKELQNKIFSMLHFGLKIGGYLFLGASENATLLHTHMEEVSRKWKIYRKTAHMRPFSLDIFSLPAYEQSKALSLPAAKGPELNLRKPALGEVLSDILISENRGAGICVDENLQVVDSFGEVSRYLLPKVFNFHLLELLPEPFALPVRSAIRQALKSGQPVGTHRLLMKDSAEEKGIHVLVKPFTDRIHEKRLLLILFREAVSFAPKAEAAVQPEAVWPENSAHTREYVESLEAELKDTRDKLQAAQEKLHTIEENMLSFNEELLSANEEMQSTNEEMQSTNEELQSVNEELQNVNSEHQIKIKELTDLNDDLNNYFRSNINGQIFVDRELHLKKFSPSVVELINLQERDIGRPLQHITTNMQVETLTEDIQKVIREGGIIVKEVQSPDKCFQVTTMPYIRQKDNTIDGAIITFYEITELKRLQTELERRNMSLVRINEDLDTFVYTVSHNLLSPIAHIQGLIELIQLTETNITPEAAKFYQLIKEAIVKFRDLIRELSEIGKVESEMLISGEEVHFEELVEDIKLSISSLIDLTHTQIDTAFEVSTIHFSKKNMRSILYNLISNAIKYRSPERTPQILLRTRSVAGSLLLSVEDNGMGIEEDKIDSIFTLYQRLSHQVEGQGIGLYLTKKIMHADGGLIEVESKVGKGTVFKLYFKQ